MRLTSFMTTTSASLRLLITAISNISHNSPHGCKLLCYDLLFGYFDSLVPLLFSTVLLPVLVSPPFFLVPSMAFTCVLLLLLTLNVFTCVTLPSCINGPSLRGHVSTSATLLGSSWLNTVNSCQNSVLAEKM